MKTIDLVCDTLAFITFVLYHSILLTFFIAVGSIIVILLSRLLSSWFSIEFAVTLVSVSIIAIGVGLFYAIEILKRVILFKSSDKKKITLPETFA